MSLEDRARHVLADAKREDERSAFDLATHRRPYVTATELAGYLDVDRRTIVRMIDKLHGVKVGRCYRIPTKKACEVFHVQQIGAS